MSKKGQQAVLDTNGNIAVSASAGSGKTTVMIEKVLRLILQGEDVRNILVMTFTHAAADEMKERLVAAIYKCLRAGEGDRANLISQLDRLPFGNISTIDSFCYAMLRKYFAAVNFDPKAIVMDEDEEKPIIYDLIDNVCEEYLDVSDLKFTVLANHFSKSRKLDNLRETVFSIRKFLLVQPDTDEYVNRVNQGLSMDESGAIMQYFYQYFLPKIRSLSDYGKDAINALNTAKKPGNRISEINEILRAINNVTTIETIYPLNSIDVSNKFRSNSTEDYSVITAYNDFAERFNGLKKEMGVFLSAYKDKEASKNNYDDCRLLIKITLEVMHRYDSYKKEHNKLGISDLSEYMLKLLDIEEIRREIQQSFTYIFVDEYQDTNYIQEKILSLISNNDNVFVVGDVKQAIYRFRFAEPKIFLDRMDKYEVMKTGCNISLNHNYRSDGRILDFINNVFSRAMTKDNGGVDYASDGMFENNNPYPDASDIPAVTIALAPNQENKKNCALTDGCYDIVKDECLEQKKDYESVFVAEKVESIVGKKKIYMPKEGLDRVIKYSDIAVLVRTRASSENILKEFDARGIPYSAEGITNAKSKALNVVADFLRLIPNIRNDVPLINVLNSRLSDFKTEELLKIHKVNVYAEFNSNFLSYAEDDEIKKKIDGFIAKLDRYKVYSAYLNADEIILRIFNEGYGSYLAQLDKRILTTVNSFVTNLKGKRYNSNIEDFLEYYDNYYKGEGSTSGENAVIVTTLHKSKGLEYPIVFIPYASINSVGVKMGEKTLFTDNALGISVKTFDDEELKKTDNFATLIHKLKTKKEERAEMLRLYYVGFTRAKNHLFISGEKTSASPYEYANNMMSVLAEINDNVGEGFANKYFLELKDNKTVSEKNDIIVGVTSQNVPLERLNYTYPYKKQTQSPSKYTVTGILKAEEEEIFNFGKMAFSESASGGEKQKSDINTGIVYHRVMQYIDYSAIDEPSITAEIARLVEQSILTAEEANLVDVNLLKKTMNSELLAFARNNKVLREQPFMLYTDEFLDGDKVLIQGVIDLLIIGEDVTLVDFKSSFSNPNELKERYSRQLNLYAEAVEKIMKKRVGKKILYNLFRNYQVEI